MFSSLGFVDQDRRSFARDNAYIGASGHPSRKEMTGAVRQESKPPRLAPPTVDELPMAKSAMAASAPQRVTETVVTVKRFEFLEMQDKRKGQELSELRTRLNESIDQSAQFSDLMHSINGTVVADAPTASDPNSEESPIVTVAKGTKLYLIFPMRRVGGGVWMRYRTVDPKTAQIEWKWVLIFNEVPGEADEVYVTDFS